MKKLIFVSSFAIIIVLAAILSFSGAIPFLKITKAQLLTKLINIEDPIVISFDGPFVPHTIESSFNISPGVVGKISFNGNQMTFIPVVPLQPGTEYKVSLKGLTPTAMGFSFSDTLSTKSLPKIIAVSPANNATIDPLKTPIKFDLDEGNKNSRLDFNIVPAFKYALFVSDDRKSFEIKPEEPLPGDTKYQVVAFESYASEKDARIWYKREIANFQFQTSSPVKVEQIIPADKTADVKEFTPVKAIFSKPVVPDNIKDFIEITPNVAGNIEWQEDNKVMLFKPQKWAGNTDYSVKIKPGIKGKDDGLLEQEVQTTFHSFDTSGLASKLGSANNDPYIKKGKYIDINLTKQILTIYEDGVNMGNYRVSTGKRVMPTPTGNFSILNKRKRAWSKKYKLFMPYFMGFTNQGHGIHELPEWPNGYKEGANHLGVPVSHGCVRMGVGPAETVYYWADIGTPVHIHY